MRSVAAFAKGLMGLLGANTDGGRGLRVMTEEVVPVVSMERFLGAARRIEAYFPLAAALIDNNYVATVPQGKCWIIRSGGVSAFSPAGGTGRFQARIRTPGSSVSSPYSIEGTLAANEFRSVPFSFQDTILEPGSQLSVYMLAIAGVVDVSIVGVIEEIEA